MNERDRTLSDGCILIEQLMKEFLRCLKNNNVDTDSFIYPVWKWTKEPLIVTSHKLIHYCKLVFQKFYSSHDFLPYRYTVHCVGLWWRLGRCFGHVLPSIEDSGFPSYFVSSSGEVSEGYAVRVVQGWAYCLSFSFLPSVESWWNGVSPSTNGVHSVRRHWFWFAVGHPSQLCEPDV